MDNTTHQVRLAQWIEIVEACNRRPEGMTARQWLNDNSISEKTYYYWQRRVRKEVLSQSKDTVPAVSAKNEITFAEIPSTFNSKQAGHYPPDALSDSFNADAIIKCGETVIALSGSISDAMLSKILEVVSHAR